MKTIFDKKAARAGAADQEEEEHTITAIMEIFAMIMHKVHKFEPDALAYDLKRGPAGYLISFRHSAAPDTGDPSFTASYDRAFYRDMRAFLLDLRDLEQDLVIKPNDLTIGTPSLLSLVDALDLYFKQDNCPLTNADNAVTGVSTSDPRQIAAALRSMAKDGRDLARDKKDAYDYYLASATRQPFVSHDHYYATIAARAKADVPVSLDFLRKDVLSLEPENDTASMDKANMSLEDSFTNCAKWRKDAPSAPQKEGAFSLLKDEAHWQLAGAIQEILAANYGLAQDLSAGAIEISINAPRGAFSQIRFACPVMPDEKTFNRYLSALHKFGEAFRKAGEGCDDNCPSPVQGNTLMLIYHPSEELFKVIANMIANQHPVNFPAQRHLRSFVHIKERAELACSPNFLN